MKYEVINEKLGIAACGIADLTMKQAVDFLAHWEDGANIGELTLFYDDESGSVVLNRDNENFLKYKKMAESYLAASESEREELRERAPECMKETILVLDNATKKRNIEGNMFIIRHNFIKDSDFPMINALYERCKNDNALMAVTMAFRYGVISGKREERARRKRGAAA